MKNLTLSFDETQYAVCKFSSGAPIPAWLDLSAEFINVVRTKDELSIVCKADQVPMDMLIPVEKPWRAFKVEGPLDFSLTGILSSIANPLADAGISIFAISTFDTDYILVKENKFEQAKTVLAERFHITPSI